MKNPSPFKWRHFEADIIVLCIRWYLRYALSYRDLEEMMAERGLSVDHTTIYRSRAALCPRAGQTLSPASRQPAPPPGEEMRPPSKSRKLGCISTEPS